MGKIRSLMGSMMKVGILGFGGGNALIPVIEQEVVTEKKMITRQDYDKDIIAATLTPGALPIELASGVGLQACGLRGMVLGGIMMALAGFACSVSASCGVFHFIYHIYEWLERIEVFVKVKKSIRVIVSGLLLTVMAGLIKSSMTTNSNPELPWFTVLSMGICNMMGV